MQNSRFVVLTGHLRDYPLSDLVGILRHQRKTGRLTIEYPKGPGTFFFHDGELVDAQVSNLTGLKAICVALDQPEASFNFNPLIQSSRRSIAPSFQRVVSELFGCWEESAVQIEGTAIAGTAMAATAIANTAIAETPISGMPILSSSERSLAPAETAARPQLISSGNPEPPKLLPAFQMEYPQPRQLPALKGGIQPRSILFLAAAAVIMVGLSTAVGLAVRLNLDRAFSEETTSAATEEAVPKTVQAQISKPSRTTRTSQQSRRRLPEVSTAKPEPKNEVASSSEPSSVPASGSSSEQADASGNSVGSTQSVKVIMQIENGRVLKAAIANHKSGMDSYEGLALRIAKQRRYPAKVTGQESVQITVARPN